MPAETCIKYVVKCPSEVAFLQELINNTDSGWPLLSKKEVPDDATEEIILMAPIPAYIGLASFEEEILVEDLYERMLSLGSNRTFANSYKKSHPSKHVTPCNCRRRTVSSYWAFLQSIPRQARELAAKNTANILPPIKETPHTSSSTLTQASANNTADMAPVVINEVLSRLASTSSTAQDNLPSAAYEDKLGMSAIELRTTLMMCGLTTGQEDILREWMFKMAKRGMTTNTKN